MDRETKEAADIVVAVAGSGLFSAILGLWFKGRAARAKQPADVVRANADLAEALSAGSSDLIDEFRREFQFLRSQVKTLQTESNALTLALRSAQGEIAQLKEENATCKREMAQLRTEISHYRGDGK